MPQLDPGSFAPQLIWLAITFTVMYLVMARVALPGVGRVLEERQARISENLEKAAKFKAEAEEAAQLYEDSIAEARQEALSAIGAVTAAASEQASGKHAELNAELAEKIAAEENRIAEARSAAMDNVREIAGDAASNIVQHLIGDTVESAESASAVEAALKEVH
ncbi:MAG: F0F1 ATP synthase subunit B' [Magnetospiraceae bacterium]